MNVQSVEAFKEKFEESLHNLPRAENSFVIVDEEHYSVLLREVMHAKNASKNYSCPRRRPQQRRSEKHNW